MKVTSVQSTKPSLFCPFLFILTAPHSPIAGQKISPTESTSEGVLTASYLPKTVQKWNIVKLKNKSQVKLSWGPVYTWSRWTEMLKKKKAISKFKHFLKSISRLGNSSENFLAQYRFAYGETTVFLVVDFTDTLQTASMTTLLSPPVRHLWPRKQNPRSNLIPSLPRLTVAPLFHYYKTDDENCLYLWLLYLSEHLYHNVGP